LLSTRGGAHKAIDAKEDANEEYEGLTNASKYHSVYLKGTTGRYDKAAKKRKTGEPKTERVLCGLQEGKMKHACKNPVETGIEGAKTCKLHRKTAEVHEP